jgi:hypothetical protein
MNIPDKIKKLTETFDYNLEMYKKGSYNDTQVRLEFINPSTHDAACETTQEDRVCGKGKEGCLWQKDKGK